MDTNEIIIRSATDPAFRAALLADPKAVLTEHGITLPDDVEVRIEESTPTEFVLAVPPALPEDLELDDDALAQASAGTGPLLIPTLLWGLGSGVAAAGGIVGGFELVKHI
ncbi:NHLP leader peptide family RiPP precursor [Nakamurella leprariae]|uniref:NHLP leader peptide family RiPP n=1 Tax=Nakamurella leprariae TaxID=2803911 RepID=A0A939BV39_9ACTN|nr:NHLP leader peptide family RiPP precursor [Nakamurella leprariae]MBM9466148.1 NHLP leader peptide family RiPP precursor [Nakamurella leprariae]